MPILTTLAIVILSLAYFVCAIGMHRTLIEEDGEDGEKLPMWLVDVAALLWPVAMALAMYVRGVKVLGRGEG
jgi:hypothetical protein